MGLVRKTLSISTLGLVNFRSKKELLQRAQAELESANHDLAQEKSARSTAEARIAAAEKRTQAAELQALKAAKDAAKLRGRKGKQARSLLERLSAVGEAVGGTVSEVFEAAEPKVRAGAEEAGRRGRKAAKATRKASKQAAARAKVEAKKAGKAGKHAAERARAETEKARKRASEALEELRAG